MPGYPCCCNSEPMINSCTDFTAWRATVTQCSLTGLAFQSTACTTCLDLNGNYVLDEANADPSPCTGVGTDQMNYVLPSPIPICFEGSDYDFTGFTLGFLCYTEDDIQYIEFILFLAHEYFVGSSGCRAIAHRVIALPATEAEISSGSLSYLAETPTPSDCLISGTVAYSFS